MTSDRFLGLIEGLSECRPVFHSEADFQLALAWYLHEIMPNSEIRLEFKPFQSERTYLDIWLHTSGVAIELKFCTRKLEVNHKSEVFTLLNQSAQDTRRYDFIRDIARLERVEGSFEQATSGFAVFLTNDPSYWEEPRQGWENTSDADFRIHEGRVVKGEMKWSKRAAKGTTKGREYPIRLRSSYHLNWRDYSNINEQKYGRFRYLAAEVSSIKT